MGAWYLFILLSLFAASQAKFPRPKNQTRISRGKAEEKCVHIVSISHGKVKYDDERKLNHFESYVNFECDRGFKLNGLERMKCSAASGQWEDSHLPECLDNRCPPLVSLPFGKIKRYDNIPGSNVNFRCDAGYRLVGDDEIECNTYGRWSAPPPVCEVDTCPPITQFAHGEVLNYDNKRSSKVQFKCDPSYKLEGAVNIRCTGAWPAWSPAVPKCVCENEVDCLGTGVKCPKIIGIPFGKAKVKRGDGETEGSVVKIVCDRGWNIKGIDHVDMSPLTTDDLEEEDEDPNTRERTVRMRCMSSGEWDIPVPECEDVRCPEIQIVANGHIKNKGNHYPGARINIRCDHGYAYRGRRVATMTCLRNGFWDKMVRCEEMRCEDLPMFEHGYVLDYDNTGRFIKYRCDKGYTLMGDKTNKCERKGGFASWRNPHPKCVFGFATCVAHGDPHYRSFDEQKLTFMGTCKYTLASTCGKAPKGLMEFNVEAKNFPGLSPTNKPVSFTKYLTVDIAGHRIKLGPGKEVIIGKAKKVGPYTIMTDGEALNLPVMGIQDMPGLTIKISGRFLELRTEKGFVVRIDEYSKADITVPAAYANIGLCGICGNFDMMPSNDLLTKDGEEITKRVQKKNREVLKYDWLKLGNSYEVPGPESEPGCMATVDPDPDCGSEEEEQQVESACGVMTDVNGLFKKCIETIGIHRIEEKFLSCKYDACLVVDREDMICQALADFADTCAEEGVPVSWRNKTFCPLACRENEEYHPLTTACPDTCNSVKESANNCPEEDREGCACVEGYVLSNAQCIPKKECGCTDDLNRYFPAGESYISGDCSANVTCQDDGKFGSTPLPACHEKAHCGYKDGQRGCTCNDGYEGDGITYCNPAVDPGTCICAGDPYYQTFDNGKLEFQGLCTYTLVEPCDGAEWSVKVENKKTNFGERSYGHRIHVDAHGHSFTLEEFQKFAVDGQEKENLVMDKLNVTHVGNAIVLQTDFGLKVSYDGRGSTGRHVASVTISNVDYYNKLCGICGNWNGNIVDDFVAKDSTGVATSTDVGNSWKTDDPCPVNAA